MITGITHNQPNSPYLRLRHVPYVKNKVLGESHATQGLFDFTFPQTVYDPDNFG